MSEPKEIIINLAGGTITQGYMDSLARQVEAAAQEVGYVHITLQNVPVMAFPRLIVDYGDVIGLLVDELREKRASKDLPQRVTQGVAQEARAAIVDHGRGGE